MENVCQGKAGRRGGQKLQLMRSFSLQARCNRCENGNDRRANCKCTKANLKIKQITKLQLKGQNCNRQWQKCLWHCLVKAGRRNEQLLQHKPHQKHQTTKQRITQVSKQWRTRRLTRLKRVGRTLEERKMLSVRNPAATRSSISNGQHFTHWLRHFKRRTLHLCTRLNYVQLTLSMHLKPHTQNTHRDKTKKMDHMQRQHIVLSSARAIVGIANKKNARLYQA